MFSYEDWLQAVRLYIKFGTSIGLTIRRLGYPSENTLKKRCQEYEHGPGLSAGYVRAPKSSQAEKEFAVAHYLEHGRCFALTIMGAGLSVPNVASILAPGAASTNPQARCWPVGGADACNEAVRGD